MLAAAETQAILRRAASCRVIVAGDLMLDEYFWGEIERISPEAPVPVLQLRRAEHMLGGAANVARNLASMGARRTRNTLRPSLSGATAANAQPSQRWH